MTDSNKIRNIAIVAHVDHGKTTLIDQLLRQSGTFHSKQEIKERVMDSNDLERERGITIFSKITSIKYKDYKINIVDTPGHADFSGEVERILMMVDAILLVVDAFEGPMPQTKFVLKKSLEFDLTTIVVINKIDRQHTRIQEVLNDVGDLYIDLGADDTQLDFPVVYASAREGYATLDADNKSSDMMPLFEEIINHAPAPIVETDGGLQMSINAMDYNEYIGRIGVGKIFRGSINLNDSILRLDKHNKELRHVVTKLFVHDGLGRKEVEHAVAGDIVAIGGVEELTIGDTITSVDSPDPLPRIKIEEPTISMNFLVNDSPFFGKEGKYISSRHIFERLYRETLTDVALKVEGSDTTSVFKVSGRGELHLSILIERMRREGYEFQISRPEVIFKEIDGKKMEPIELLICDIPEEYMGTIIEKISQRKGEIQDIKKSDRTIIEFLIPTRGIIGFRSEFLSLTHGEGIMHHNFEYYKPYKGDISGRDRGSLIAMEAGTVTAYAIDSLKDRGTFFVDVGIDAYPGMIVGVNNKNEDIIVNISKVKKLTNMRAAGSDAAIIISPPKKMSLEECIEFINNDELVEVTPKSVRMRKKILDHNKRKKSNVA